METKNAPASVEINVFDIYGQKLKSSLLKNVLGYNTKIIDLKERSSGLYLITFTENGQLVYSRKIIKK
ncbi:MAG: T9SS type A sorting domain-containing protein [Prolixibacteraceae bacterium]|nr:T9SS type A sorting domain-containing protein [Prolixibacteraceae bacterium]